MLLGMTMPSFARKPGRGDAEPVDGPRSFYNVLLAARSRGGSGDATASCRLFLSIFILLPRPPPNAALTLQELQGAPQHGWQVGDWSGSG